MAVIRTGYIDADIVMSAPYDIVCLDEIGATPVYSVIYDHREVMTGVIFHALGKINMEPFHISISGDMKCEIAPAPDSLVDEYGRLPGLKIKSIETSAPVEVENNCVMAKPDETFNVTIEGALYADPFTMIINSVHKIEFSQSLYKWYKKG